MVILTSFANFKMAFVSFKNGEKNGHLVMANCIGGLPRNSVARITDHTHYDLNYIVGP